MQFADFISCGFDQIVNQAATLRYRYGGRASVPIVVRAPSGGNVGGGLYHSQNPEAWFIHRPGPEGGGAVDAVRRQGPAEGGDPRRQPGRSTSSTSICTGAPRARCPKATRSCRSAWRRSRREGDDITLLTYGAMVTPSLEAADRLAKEGVEVEVIDLRTLLPFDKDAIFASVEKTNRVADRARGREDARPRRRAVGGDHGRAVRRARRAGAARHLSRHASARSRTSSRRANLPNADKITDALRTLAAY